MPMSTAGKRILAIGVVAIVIVGVGIGAWFVLQPRSPYVVPGMGTGVPYDRIIKVGILDPMTEIQGKSAWNGAYLAAWEINEAGGVLINGTRYYIGLVSEDTYEAEASLDVTRGTAAATKILSEDKAEFIMGGFRTESLASYIEPVMDAKKLFFITGSATDSFCANVLSNYAKYKYTFRNMPINSTSLGHELVTYFGYLKAYLWAAKGINVTKAAIIREDLEWTQSIDTGLTAALWGYFGISVVKDVAYDPSTVTVENFNTYWGQIDAAGAQIAVPVISGPTGILMTQGFNNTQPKCLVCGINVPSQYASYWASSLGKCAYEITMMPVVNSSKTPKTVPFYNHYVGNYSDTPLYTGVGCYDSVYTLAWAINATQSLNSDVLVTQLETLKPGNTLVGVSAWGAYTRSHDVVEGYMPDTPPTPPRTLYGVTLFVQWQPDGKFYALSSGGALYPDSAKTGNLMVPPWGINP